MSQEFQIVTRRVALDHVTPVSAYASLRAKVPNRSSFLFESARPAEGMRRYSVLGYRARAEAMFPPGGEVFGEIAKGLESVPPTEGLAAQLSQALWGYISYDAAHRIHGVDPWPDEDNLSRMMRDCSIALFDHLEHTITIAGRSPGAINRLEWEMRNEDPLTPLPVPDPDAITPHGSTSVDDDNLAARAARAKAAIEQGEADRVVLARHYKAPLRDADPFDIFRAMRPLMQSAFHFFLEFNDMPMAKGLSIAGSADEPILDIPPETSTRAETLDRLRQSFPSESAAGAPRDKATKLIRKLEKAARGPLGGSVGYISGEGHARMFATTHAVVLSQAQFSLGTQASVDKDVDTSTLSASTTAQAKPAFAAIHAAHLAAEAREEALKRKREAEAKKEAEEEAKTAAEAGSQSDSGKG